MAWQPDAVVAIATVAVVAVVAAVAVAAVAALNAAVANDVAKASGQYKKSEYCQNSVK